MFEQYDPRKGHQYQLLNEKGRLRSKAAAEELPEDAELLRAWDFMVQGRAADIWAVSLQRQGRMPTYPPNLGQEANAVGALMAVRDDDWFVQSFRELGGLIVRGIPLHKLYLYYMGNEMGSHLEKNKYFALPVSVPIASQLLHAVGIAYAEKYRNTGRVVLAFIGDGGTSQGDFHEALNFAATLKLPVIFYVQNNQFAISMSRRAQTSSRTIAEKAFGYGMEGIQIDGNDAAAVISTVRRAAGYCRDKKMPVLIEGYTYRMGAHTTADDPRRYRSDEEVESWAKRDPIARLEKYLISRSVLSEGQIADRTREAEERARREFEICEQTADPGLDDIFDHTYAELPPILIEQKEELRRDGVGQ